MWLPTPVYKALPTLYAVIGVTFILGVLYIGVDAQMGPTYLAVGLVSILASITVRTWRNRHRSKAEETRQDESQES